MAEDFRPHLFVKDVHTSQKYKVTPRKINVANTTPVRDRAAHGQTLLAELGEVWQLAHQEALLRRQQNLPTKDGAYISFKSPALRSLRLRSNKGRKEFRIKITKRHVRSFKLPLCEECCAKFAPSSLKSAVRSLQLRTVLSKE